MIIVKKLINHYNYYILNANIKLYNINFVFYNKESYKIRKSKWKKKIKKKNDHK